MGNDIFIAQQNVEDALYTHLQRKTIDQLQLLSGKVWTDYNAHDPGVTIADIANYVLTEVDYKLGFDLLDYLTDQNGEFLPVKYGLYLPEDIYPTTPVTLEDYQKLLLSKFPLLKSVTFTRSASNNGSYNVNVELFPSDDLNICNINNAILKCFHANRNLCENINQIKVDTPQPLYLYAEMDIEPGINPTVLLAKIYWHIQKYLSGSIEIERQEDQTYSDMPIDQWLDGPNVNNQRITIPKLKNTETELYLKLKKIKGVKAFKAIYFLSEPDNEKSIITNFNKRHTLHIPECLSDFKVKMTIDNSEVIIDVDKFTKVMRAIFYSQKSSSLNQRLEENTKDDLYSSKSLPLNIYRDIFSHKNMAFDFPGHYGISESGLPLSAPTKNKANAKQLKAYLTLFDLIVRRGLSEVKGLKTLLDVNGENSADTKQRIVSQDDWNHEILENGANAYNRISDKKKFKDICDLKNSYLDFLDKLYGVDSYPSWMDEYKYYGKTEESYLNMRVKFMQLVPYLTRNRSRAANILNNEYPNGLSTVKIYLSTLLDMHLDEDLPIGNILPSHKVILMDDDKAGIRDRDIINHKLSEETFGLYKTEHIEPDTKPKSDSKKSNEYEELRRSMTFFNGEYMSGGLFRAGVKLENYRLLHISGNEFVLAFWNKEDSTWMNLMRSNDQKKLIRLANALHRYLIDLNSLCEVVYVVEHNFFHPVPNDKLTPENQQPLDYKFNVPFTITFAFSNWSSRLKYHRFRNICSKLIESIVPAHIKTNIYWLNVPQMQKFENSYNQWREGLRRNNPVKDMTRLQQGIYDVFWEMEKEIQLRNIGDNS